MPTARVVRALLPVLVAACAASSPWDAQPRPARDLPGHFVIEAEAPPAGPGCAVHLRDPRTGARITLVRSTERSDPNGPGGKGVVGDYAVEPTSRYGASSAELLRLDCLTGQALGVVRR